jgi:hypothetical protein
MTTSKPEHAARRSGKILQLARLLFTPIALTIIAWFIWINRDQLLTLVASSNAFWLIAALVLWASSHLVSPLIGVLLFQACGIHIAYDSCLRIHCSRLPAKYLPGGIWHSVGRANDYLLLGHAQGKVAMFFLLENVLLVGVTFAMSAPLVSRLLPVQELQAIVIAGAVLAILGVILTPLLLQLVSRRRLTIKLQGYLSAIPALLLYWCIVGLSFASYLRAFSELSLQGTVLETVAVYVFSWCMGYLAIFAPQGVGVLEFVSGYLLDGPKGLQLVGLVAGFRLVILLADISTWLTTVVAGKTR